MPVCGEGRLEMRRGKEGDREGAGGQGYRGGGGGGEEKKRRMNMETVCIGVNNR